MARRKSERDDVKLRRLLGTAAQRFAAVKGLIRSDYESGAEVAQFVRQCNGDIEHGTLNRAQKKELLNIFAPAGDFDNVVGDVDLGNEVFVLLDRLYGNEPT